MFIFRKFMFKKLMCKKLLFKYALSHQMMRRKSVASKKPVITSKPRESIMTTKKLCLLLTLIMTNCMSRVFAPAPDTQVTDAQIMAHYGITEETFSYWEEEARKDARIKVARSMAHCGKIEKDEKDDRDVLEQLGEETLARDRDHMDAVLDMAKDMDKNRQALLELHKEVLDDLREIQEHFGNGNLPQGLAAIQAKLLEIERQVAEKLQGLNDAINDGINDYAYTTFPNDLNPVQIALQPGSREDKGAAFAKAIKDAGGPMAFAKKLSLEQKNNHKYTSERMRVLSITQNEGRTIQKLTKDEASACNAYLVWKVNRNTDEARAQAAKERGLRVAAEARANRIASEAAEPRYIFTANSYDSEAKIAAADAKVEVLTKELEDEKNKNINQPIYTEEENSGFKKVAEVVGTGVLVVGGVVLAVIAGLFVGRTVKKSINSRSRNSRASKPLQIE